MYMALTKTEIFYHTKKEEILYSIVEFYKFE